MASLCGSRMAFFVREDRLNQCLHVIRPLPPFSFRACHNRAERSTNPFLGSERSNQLQCRRQKSKRRKPSDFRLCLSYGADGGLEPALLDTQDLVFAMVLEHQGTQKRRPNVAPAVEDGTGLPVRILVPVFASLDRSLSLGQYYTKPFAPSIKGTGQGPISLHRLGLPSVRGQRLSPMPPPSRSNTSNSLVILSARMTSVS